MMDRKKLDKKEGRGEWTRACWFLEEKNDNIAKLRIFVI